jgi:hypothetical protein
MVLTLLLLMILIISYVDPNMGIVVLVGFMLILRASAKFSIAIHPEPQRTAMKEEFKRGEGRAWEWLLGLLVGALLFYLYLELIGK